MNVVLVWKTTPSLVTDWTGGGRQKDLHISMTASFITLFPFTFLWIPLPMIIINK
jgi:hypothetical protein